MLMMCRWNVNRLMELEEQMGKFKSAIGDSIRKSSPLRQQEGGCKDSRVYLIRR